MKSNKIGNFNIFVFFGEKSSVMNFVAVEALDIKFSMKDLFVGMVIDLYV